MVAYSSLDYGIQTVVGSSVAFNFLLQIELAAVQLLVDLTFFCLFHFSPDFVISMPFVVATT